MPDSDKVKWMLKADGDLLTLGELSEFVKHAYAHGGVDDTPIRVETNVTLKASQVGIRKIWTGDKQ